MKNLIVLLFAIFFSFRLGAQTDVILRINHFLGVNEFNLDELAHNDLGQEFKVSRCVYYISKFTVIHDGGLETDITTDTIALVDASSAPFTDIELGEVTFTTIEGVKFHIGVQEPENNADPSLWPADHPLAHQVPSMHWGWTAGYRFMTFEGWSGEGFDREISLHGIGNDYYYTTTVMASSFDEGGKEVISISADYRKVISTIDVSSGVYSHGVEKSILALQNFNTKVFGTEVLENPEENVNHDWSLMTKTEKEIYISIGNIEGSLGIKIFDLSGKLVHNNLLLKNDQYAFGVEISGAYLVSLYSDNALLETKKIIIK